MKNFKSHQGQIVNMKREFALAKYISLDDVFERIRENCKGKTFRQTSERTVI